MSAPTRDDLKRDPAAFFRALHEQGFKIPAWQSSLVETLMKDQRVYYMGRRGLRSYPDEVFPTEAFQTVLDDPLNGHTKGTRYSGVDWSKNGDFGVRVEYESRPDGTMCLVSHQILNKDVYIDDVSPVDVEAIQRHIREHINRQHNEDMEHLMHGGSSIQMRLVPGSNPPRFEPR